LKDNVQNLEPDIWYNRLREESEKIEDYYKNVDLPPGASREIALLLRVKDLEDRLSRLESIFPEGQ